MPERDRGESVCDRDGKMSRIRKIRNRKNNIWGDLKKLKYLKAFVLHSDDYLLPTMIRPKTLVFFFLRNSFTLVVHTFKNKFYICF